MHELRIVDCLMMKSTITQLRSDLVKVIQIHSIYARKHSALAATRLGHINAKLVDLNAELFVPVKVRHDLCILEDFPSRQASNVWA